MWRQPQYSELEIPEDMKEMIYESIYYNSEGNLAGAKVTEIFEKGLMFFISWIAVSLMTAFLLLILFQATLIWQFGASLFLLILISVFFYLWGWKSYEEAWYHFNMDQEILTVISRNNRSWETVEIPFETVNRVLWDGGEYGRAIIHAGSFKYATSRAGSKRHSSVTEIWEKLARLDCPMIEWPVALYCPKCNRQFGHHIGTARCPFDGVILIDPNVKGRIDPDKQHPDDLDRI